MSKILVFWTTVISIIVIAVSAVTAQDPFARADSVPSLRQQQFPPTLSQPFTLPTDAPIVRAPSSPILPSEGARDSSLSPRQVTALEPRPGTGSQSIIGAITNPKAELTVKLDSKLLDALQSLATSLQGGNGVAVTAPINLAVPEEISALSSRVSTPLSLLLYVGAFLLSHSAAARVLPWVSRAGAFLESFGKGLSIVTGRAMGSSSPVNESTTGKVAEASSTQRPAS